MQRDLVKMDLLARSFKKYAKISLRSSEPIVCDHVPA
jgi:hypothetical protein